MECYRNGRGWRRAERCTTPLYTLYSIDLRQDGSACMSYRFRLRQTEYQIQIVAPATTAPALQSSRVATHSVTQWSTSYACCMILRKHFSRTDESVQLVAEWRNDDGDVDEDEDASLGLFEIPARSRWDRCAVLRNGTC